MIEDHTILIIDDEIDICFLLSNILKKKYKKVESIHSIKEIRITDFKKYDLIFIDNNLSDGSGFDEIQNILESNERIKVIAISAFDTLSEKNAALERGATIFIGKPFSQSLILNVTSELIAKK